MASSSQESVNLFALVHGPDAPIAVGSAGVFQAGIRVEAVEDARTAAIDINMLVLHDDKIALIGDWQWNLRVDPSCSQTVLVSVPYPSHVHGDYTRRQ